MKMILKEDGKPRDKVAPVMGHWVLWSCMGHSLSGLAKSSNQLTEKGFITNSLPQRNPRELHSSTHASFSTTCTGSPVKVPFQHY